MYNITSCEINIKLNVTSTFIRASKQKILVPKAANLTMRAGVHSRGFSVQRVQCRRFIRSDDKIRWSDESLRESAARGVCS